MATRRAKEETNEGKHAVVIPCEVSADYTHPNPDLKAINLISEIDSLHRYVQTRPHGRTAAALPYQSLLPTTGFTRCCKLKTSSSPGNQRRTKNPKEHEADVVDKKKTPTTTTTDKEDSSRDEQKNK